MRSTLPALGLAFVIGAVVYGSARARTAPDAAVVASIVVPPAAAPPPRERPRARITEGSIAAHVEAAAQRHGVPAALVAAVVSVESEFNPRAVSPRGALGLMQLMPTTAALLGVRDAFDPKQNVDAGARHLRDLLDQFANDVSLALAAYNAGAQAVIRHGGVPPYPETRAFVARVLARAERMTMPAAAFAQAAHAPAPARVRIATLAADRLRRDDDTVILATTPDELGIAEAPPPPAAPVEVARVSAPATPRGEAP